MDGNPDIPGNTVMSDVDHFHLHDSINKQNFQY
jgi:hypothetical protein